MHAERAGPGPMPGQYLFPSAAQACLIHMMAIVRNEQEDKTVRLDAAKAAAPYVHARLQTTTLAGDPEKPLKLDNPSELEAARRLAFLMTTAASAA